MKLIKGLVLSALIAVSLALTGCGADAKATDKPVVYASFYPIHSLVEEVGGDAIEVRSFMPAGKDPHLWRPTPKNIKELSEADLLVVNGANMERWLDQVRDALPDLPVLVLSDSIELITYKGAASIGDFQYLAQLPEGTTKLGIGFGHTHEDIMRVAFFDNTENLKGDALIDKCKEIMNNQGKNVIQKSTTDVEDKQVYGITMGHESGHVDFNLPHEGNWVFISDRDSEPLLPYNLKKPGSEENLEETTIMKGSSSGKDKITYDPHSWLSVQNAKIYCNEIQNVLIERYPEHTRQFKRNKLKIVDALTDLTSEYVMKFKECDKKEFVTSHYAFEYLAREFGLIQFPLQGLTSMESPSLKTIRKAVDFCNFYGINTIFYEYGTQAKGAQTLADEIGGKVNTLASMEYMAPDAHEDESQSYENLMRQNLENLYQSLKN